MTFQAVPNTIEVDVRGTYIGQQVENTLYLRMDHAPTAGDVADAAAAISGWFIANVIPLVGASYVLRAVHAKDLTVFAGAEADDIAGAGTAGTAAGSPYPGNVALAMSFQTGLGGRSFRGRNYIAGLTSGQVSGNTVTSAAAAAFQAAYNQLLTELVSSSFTWVVVSRVTGGVLRAAGITTPVLVALLTDLLVDSMRRRLAGRGV
jgi:hypothetical protein